MWDCGLDAKFVADDVDERDPVVDDGCFDGDLE